MEARARALGAERLQPSWRASKKWAVFYDGVWIHFGQKGAEDYTIHRDPKRRASYRRRAAGILLQNGEPAYQNPHSPAYWAWHLLW